jgi:hypothetical protein
VLLSGRFPSAVTGLSDLCPVDAVKLLVPSLSVAPTGMPLTASDDRLLLSPGRPSIVMLSRPQMLNQLAWWTTALKAARETSLRQVSAE